ncbi:MAG: tRNA uridine(34) 5-carboxymethylaminomethyl modification radical SAM/GNAT enzyme Elp3 [Candidatus Nitrosocosmicus sp.]|nr:tRNA uridine(34) 5-carboxymethylaminomethyl modification radical SAM/GNAT enzyme Elp3 [Candidatus Nitrosocosmicus sp.]MDN5865824.1 tRNA uridine(34) 5-carboxymethylaminomethyl modification radical SAM/GNAT enzyme Elp3 [Candidatus Nitrosocosmicus sp.]
MFVNASRHNAKDDNQYQQICKEIANDILSRNDGSNLMSISEINKLIKSKSSLYKLPSIPKYAEINRFIPITSQYKRLLRKKPVKTRSGIAVITVMPMPYDCPHGKCIYCPGGKEYNTPLSYIGTEPSTRFAQRVKYDSYEQIRYKIMQLMEGGHEVSKAELVIVGGTFPFYPKDYQIYFVKRCYDALNSIKHIDLAIQTPIAYSGSLDENTIFSLDSSKKASTFKTNSLLLSLNKSKEQNETAFVRCVGLTIETKPDYCKMDHINMMLELGTTRIELGVQSLNDSVFKMVNRGHTIDDVYRAFYEARNSGYKIGAHMMPGLPGSSCEQDLNDSKNLFEDERLKPDMLKIYPTLVVRNTGLYKLYQEQKYKSYSTNELVELLVEIKKIIPPWVRIMRIQREIEAPDIISGPKIGNIRQLVLKELKRQGIKCNCIRCREIGLYENKIEFSDDDVLLFRTEYNASRGREIFLTFELKDRTLLLGFLRLRIMSDPLRKELQTKTDFKTGSSDSIISDSLVKSLTSAIVREIHVYGTVAKVGEQVSKKQQPSSTKTKSVIKVRNGDTSNDSIQSMFNFPAIAGSLVPKIQVKYQHKGLGRRLLAEAERICKEEYGLKKISVISAVGTRDYYRKFGYTNNGPYVTKLL